VSDPKVYARSLSLRQALAIAVGNGLEFYDFVTYAFFATQIGRTFFPSKTPGLSLLSSLATFGVGFLTRPLGAMVIDRFGDRAGRKPAMMLSLCLIGVAVTGLSLTPSYASIGTLAPVWPLRFACFRDSRWAVKWGRARRFYWRPHRLSDAGCTCRFRQPARTVLPSLPESLEWFLSREGSLRRASWMPWICSWRT